MQRFLCSIFIVCVTSCGYSERNHPEEYIKIVAEPWEGQTDLELEVINTAQHTDFGMIKILVTYLENGRNLGTEPFIHYEIITAGSNSVLKVKLHPPELGVHANEISFAIEAQVANHYRKSD